MSIMDNYFLDLLPLTALVAANVVGPVFFLIQSNYRDLKSVEINHELLFSYGFLYYWIAPILMGLLGLFRDGPGMGLWYSIFDELSEHRVKLYLLLCLVCYSSFCIGSITGRVLGHRPLSKRNGPLGM